MQHGTEYTANGQETVAAITMTVVVVINENPFSLALSAVPFLTLNGIGVDNGFLSRNSYKKHLDGEGAWVIKGGIRGPQAQRAVPRGTGAKTVCLLPVHEAESTCPSRRDTGPVACQEAPGGGMEDRQRKTSWIRTVGNSLELTDSGPWKGTRALAGNHLQARRLSASLYPERALGTG